MNDENLDILQNLEFSVVNIWRHNPEMTDYCALRAYDAAFQFYRAEARGRTPKPHDLTGLDAKVFDAVKTMCEFRLGRGQALATAPADLPAVPVQRIVDSLRQLAKSVERHTQAGGRQGYLTFVSAFFP